MVAFQLVVIHQLNFLYLAIPASLRISLYFVASRKITNARESVIDRTISNRLVNLKAF